MDGSVLSAPYDPQATLLIPQQNPIVPIVNPARKSNKLLWIISASVVLLIAATIAVIALTRRNTNSNESPAVVTQQEKTKSSESNINNRSDNLPSVSKTVIENKNTENANAQSGNETATEDLRSLQKYVGKYAGDMFKKEAGLKQRLTNLLGSNYQLFMERWDVTGPIEDDGGILFAEGCMAHACGSEESLLAIDTSKGIIYCAVLSDSFGGKIKTFYESNSSVPTVMKDKIQELMNLK
jgi:hypothetical protein